jgi:hypothetical protein
VGLIDAILGSLFPPAPQALADVTAGRRALVRGRVVPRDVIESPLSGVRCVYYRYVIEELRRASVPIGFGADGFWVVTERDEAIAEFYLQDEGGRAIVAPHRAFVEIPRALPGEPLDWPRGRRGQELVILAGDLVEVDGLVQEVDDLLDEQLHYRERPRKLVLRAPDDGVIRIRVIARGA